MSEFFRRVEKKYIITKEQYTAIEEAIKGKMVEDEHGKSIIYNLYLDTGQFELIRHSITKPIYKDKVRLRSYSIPNNDTPIYLEIKRKYDGVVSKRRVETNLNEFHEYLSNNEENKEEQVEKELHYYFKHYNLKPTMFVSYYRGAYYDREDSGFRLTFDSEVVARNYDLELEKGVYGTDILGKDKYIMEVKTLGAIPMWFVKILDELKIRPCGFSKYGEAYTQLILKEEEENVRKYI